MSARCTVASSSTSPCGRSPGTSDRSASWTCAAPASSSSRLSRQAAASVASTCEKDGIPDSGWPMTVFATPDGDPFYAGTYFPPQPLSGMPSFSQVLATLAAATGDRLGDLHVDGVD